MSKAKCALPPAKQDLSGQFEIPRYRVSVVRETGYHVDHVRVRTASDVYDLLRQHFTGLDRESFVVILLDTQNQIRGLEVVSVGTLDASLVHPRETFRLAVKEGAASIIIAHNHPSGDPTPSAEDRSVTRQLRSAGELLGIDVLDHVIVGEGRFVSFVEAGLMG